MPFPLLAEASNLSENGGPGSSRCWRRRRGLRPLVRWPARWRRLSALRFSAPQGRELLTLLSEHFFSIGFTPLQEPRSCRVVFHEPSPCRPMLLGAEIETRLISSKDAVLCSSFSVGLAPLPRQPSPGILSSGLPVRHDRVALKRRRSPRRGLRLLLVLCGCTREDVVSPVSLALTSSGLSLGFIRWISSLSTHRRCPVCSMFVSGGGRLEETCLLSLLIRFGAKAGSVALVLGGAPLGRQERHLTPSPVGVHVDHLLALAVVGRSDRSRS